MLLSISILYVQSCCTKSKAQINTGSTTKLNKLVFIRLVAGNSQIWISDNDGNSASQIPIVMLAGAALSTDFGTMDVKFSPDVQTIFFMGVLIGTNTSQIYACDIDGQNVRTAVSNSNDTDYLKIEGAY